jgi:hypothetical protein
MFIRRVKMNFKEYSRPLMLILLTVLVQMYGEVAFDWHPLRYVGCLKFLLLAVVAGGGLAFLKTLWELLNAKSKKLCTFVVAVAKFSGTTGRTKSWRHEFAGIIRRPGL